MNDYATQIRQEFIQQFATPAQELRAYLGGGLAVVIFITFIVGVL